MQKFPTPVPVVAVALVGGDGRVLMQKRRSERMHGGLWEFPGGKLEPGESPETALIREAREELGIDISTGCLKWLADSGAPADAEDSSETPIVISLYTCRMWQGDVQCLDAEELGWFAPDAILLLPMPPLDVPLAEVLARVLAGSLA